MRFIIIYILVFGLGAVSIYFMISQSSRSERALTGVWKEVSWEYERVDFQENQSLSFENSYTAELKEKLGQTILFHQDEEWIFHPNGNLILSTADGLKDSVLQWNLKGRGDKLVLKKEGEVIESYQVSDLTENRMVLNFNVDMQAKGIAKLTFEKIQ